MDDNRSYIWQAPGNDEGTDEHQTLEQIEENVSNWDEDGAADVNATNHESFDEDSSSTTDQVQVTWWRENTRDHQSLVSNTDDVLLLYQRLLNHFNNKIMNFW